MTTKPWRSPMTGHASPSSATSTARHRRFGAGICLGLAAVLGWASVSWACSSQASVAGVSPSAGPAGSEVMVTGDGFYQTTVPGQGSPIPVEIHWGGRDGPILAKVSGTSFTTGVTIPAATPGTHAIVAVGYNPDGTVSGMAAGTFTVARSAQSVAPVEQAPASQTPVGSAEPAPAPSDTPATAAVPAAAPGAVPAVAPSIAAPTSTASVARPEVGRTPAEATTSLLRRLTAPSAVGAPTAVAPVAPANAAEPAAASDASTAPGSPSAVVAAVPLPAAWESGPETPGPSLLASSASTSHGPGGGPWLAVLAVGLVALFGAAGFAAVAGHRKAESPAG